MKPFIASEFISNQETPVVGRNEEPVEIVSVKARGGQPVIGYTNGDYNLCAWYANGTYRLSGLEDAWDLFFATKVEVIHVFERKDGGGTEFVRQEDDGDDDFHSDKYHTYLGTITGPIVPPTKDNEVAK